MRYKTNKDVHSYRTVEDANREPGLKFSPDAVLRPGLTQREQTENALRASEADLAHAQWVAHIGSWRLKVQEQELRWSDETYRIFEYPLRSPVTLDHFRVRIHPDDRACVNTAWDEALQGKHTYDIEHRLMFGKRIKWVRELGEIERDAAGRPVSCFGAVQDITERKSVEEQLRGQIAENLKRTQELEAIVQISAATRQAKTRPEMMNQLLRQLLSTTGAQAGALGMLNGTALEFQAATDEARGWIGKVLPPGNNLFWDVMRDGSPRFADKSAQGHSLLDPFGAENPEIQAGMITPLKNGSATIGVIWIGYSRHIEISSTQKRLVAAITDMAGSALHRLSIAGELHELIANRTHELKTIYTVIAEASQPVGLRNALNAALISILETTQAETGAIYTLDERGRHIRVLADQGLPTCIRDQIEAAELDQCLEGWVFTHRQAWIVADLRNSQWSQWTRALTAPLPFAALPMQVGGRVVGVIEIARQGGKPFELDELTLLSFISDHLGLIIENTTLQVKAEQNAVLEERSRLARDLHDSVTQYLYSATLFADGGRRSFDQGEFASVRDSLIQIAQVSQQALREMRLMVFELHSPALRSAGLVHALQHRIDAVENRAGIAASIEVVGQLPDLPECVQDGLYRIALEALNNALKHAHPQNVLVSLETKGETLCLCVADDGNGFDPVAAAQNGGLGLTSMRERAERLSGRLHIYSEIGSGSEIIAELPSHFSGTMNSTRRFAQ